MKSKTEMYAFSARSSFFKYPIILKSYTCQNNSSLYVKILSCITEEKDVHIPLQAMGLKLTSFSENPFEL